MYVPNIGFCSLSFEKIIILNSYFIRRYKIIKYESSSNLRKIHPFLWEVWSLFMFKNGFHSLSFEKTSILNSYFIHRYIIIKYRSSSNLGIIYLYYGSYDPLLVLYTLSAL